MGKADAKNIVGLSIKKVVVIGPESTGKSTLSKALAEEYQTVWVPEYARIYLNETQRDYEENDLLLMAKGQLESENILVKKAQQFLICDTDLYVFKVWSEHAYQHCHRWILEQIASRKYDLYLLTGIDIPWEADPLREHSSPHLRSYFYHQYKDIVQQSGVPWEAINGSPQERLDKALNTINRLLN